MNTQKGITGLITLIIIATLIALILGFNPKEIFIDHIIPVVKFGWEVLVSIVLFINDVLVWAMSRVRDMLGIMQIEYIKSLIY